METGGWNYAKRRGSWSAPRVVQVFEGEAAREMYQCSITVCTRAALSTGMGAEPIACRPICERAVEARLRTLGTGATSPDGPTYFDQPSDLTPDRFGVCWTEDAPRPMVLTPWNVRGK
jgi:hypothetical protein